MLAKIDISQIFINPSQRLRYIVLFSSKVIDGFGIRYNFIDATLEAGLPLIKGETTNLLDGNMHQIGYTYKKDIGQELYLDGIKIAFGMFTGEVTKSVTGMAIKESGEERVIEGIEVGYLDRALSEGELKEIFNRNPTTPQSKTGGLLAR